MNQSEFKALKERLKTGFFDDDGKALFYALIALQILYGFIYAIFALF